VINKEINKLRANIDNIKDEATQDMENFRIKTETEMQNKMESQCSRIEQTEDRISEFKDEMVIKEKTKEHLLNNSRPMKRKCKNLLTSSKDQN
jgi:hypothetical protein